MAIVPFSKVEVPDEWSLLPTLQRAADHGPHSRRPAGERRRHRAPVEPPTPTAERQSARDDGFAAPHDTDGNTTPAEEAPGRPTHAPASGTAAAPHKTKNGTRITKDPAEPKPDPRPATPTTNAGPRNPETAPEAGAAEGHHPRPDRSKRKADAQTDKNRPHEQPRSDPKAPASKPETCTHKPTDPREHGAREGPRMSIPPTGTSNARENTTREAKAPADGRRNQGQAGAPAPPPATTTTAPEKTPQDFANAAGTRPKEQNEKRKAARRSAAGNTQPTTSPSNAPAPNNAPAPPPGSAGGAAAAAPDGGTDAGTAAAAEGDGDRSQ
jgi:hypothetical protein